MLGKRQRPFTAEIQAAAIAGIRLVTLAEIEPLLSMARGQAAETGQPCL